MTAGRTEPLTKQVALTSTETHLGDLFGESTGKVRLTIPSNATSSVWLGKNGVATSGDDGGGVYLAGTQTQLPTTSLLGWYAITDGASVTVTIEMATGGVDAPDWIAAGATGASNGGGGGGGEVTQGAGSAANPWTMQGVNAGVGERLATQADQTNGDQKTRITDGTNDAVVMNSAPVGTEYGIGTRAIGNTATTNAASSQADGHSASIGATTDLDSANTLIGRIKQLLTRIPVALGAGGGLKVDGSGTPLPVNGTVTANAGTGNFATTNAVSSQADGHSASIGATTDASSASTVIGQLKKIVSLLPSALVSNRLDNNIGSWFGATTPTVGQKTMAASIPVVVASDQTLDTELPPAVTLSNSIANPTAPMVGSATMVYDGFSTGNWHRLYGNQYGVAVQGYSSQDSTFISGRPVVAAGTDGGNVRTFRTDTTGRLSIIGNRVSRTAHLASAVLPAAGAFTSQTPYTVPEGVTQITAYITYTRGDTGGTVLLRPQWANGTETAREAVTVSTSASSENQRDTLGFREYVSPSVSGAIVFRIVFDVPAGATTFVLFAAELGATATPGTCAITLTAKYGP